MPGEDGADGDQAGGARPAGGKGVCWLSRVRVVLVGLAWKERTARGSAVEGGAARLACARVLLGIIVRV